MTTGTDAILVVVVSSLQSRTTHSHPGACVSVPPFARPPFEHARLSSWPRGGQQHVVSSQFFAAPPLARDAPANDPTPMLSPHGAMRASSRGTVVPTASCAFVQRGSQTWRSDVSAASPPLAASRASLRPGEPSRARLRLPASWTALRACPRGCGVSPRGRIRRPAWTTPYVGVCRAALASTFLSQA